jgi:hypothetical protein
MIKIMMILITLRIILFMTAYHTVIPAAIDIAPQQKTGTNPIRLVPVL